MVVIPWRSVFLAAAAVYRSGAVTVLIVPWEKFIYREFKPFKDIAWILRLAICAAIAGAFLYRHADVICRHQQLDIPFQPDNGKLSQCDIQLAYIAIQNDVISKHASQRFRYLIQITAAAAAAVRIHHLCPQQQWVQCFCLCRRLFPQSACGAAVLPALPEIPPEIQLPIPDAYGNIVHFPAVKRLSPPENPSPPSYD